MPSVEGVGPRRAALTMLDLVLRQGQTLDAASARPTAKLSPADKGLAIAIAGETLRRLPDLDDLIDSATRQRLPDDSKARMVIRLALAQKIGLDTPEHAVVATALPLVDGGPRRLVHGVLGTLLRRGLPAVGASRLPEAVEQRWAAAWGPDVVEAARRLIVTRPPLDLSFGDDAEAQRFAADNDGVSLAARHVRLTRGPVAELPGFAAGGWWVQDLAASIPARLVPAAAAQVLDLCAAPGGKTMQLAAAGHQVTAVDSAQSRLGRLADNLGRTGLAADLVAADALGWRPGPMFDAILLDAPCSATGTFRRHPEVLHRAGPRIIAESAALQAKLIRHAGTLLKPGAALIYSVCSLEPREGEEVVAAFLAERSEFTVSEPQPGELPDFIRPTAEGAVRTLPGLLEEAGGLDGFFAVRLVRAGA